MLSPHRMETIRQDITLAIRYLRKTPGFTIPAVLTLALGIGANTTIFSLTDALMFRRLAVADANRIVHVFQTRPNRPADPYPLSMADYADVRDRSKSFEILAAHYPTSPMHILIDGEPIAANGAVATANYFDVMQLTPALGRFYTADEDRVRDRDAVVVISYGFWQRHFGGSIAVIGKQIQINGRMFAIVGVTPRGFNGTRIRDAEHDAWIPAAMFTNGYRYCDAFARDCRVVELVGKLKPSITREQAQTELDVIARAVGLENPQLLKGLGYHLVEAKGVGLGIVTSEIEQLQLFLVVVGVVLLMACANVAGLLMARASARGKELAMRLALGATRARVMRQLLTETAVLAALGTVAGLLVAVWGNALLESVYSHDGAGRPVSFSLVISANVFAATAAIAIAAVFLVGLIPSISAGRADVVSVIKDDSGSGGGRRSRARVVLVTAQMAASVLLLIGAALLLQSVWNLNRGANFDPDHVATFRLRPSLVDYPRARAHAFQRRAIEAIEAVPGVTGASPSVYMSMLAGGGNVGVSLDPAAAADARKAVLVGHTGANYFKTLGVPLIEGRDFSDHDTLDAPRVAIVNDVFAHNWWPSTSAVGKSVYVNGRPYSVIAVARDAQFYSSGEPVREQIFLSYWQPLNDDPFVNDSRMVVRTSGDPAALMATIRRAIAAVDPAVPISEDQPLADRVSYTYQAVRFARAMMVGVAVLALVLSAIGVYGVLAFSVSQRTREMAIRFALGATRGEVASLVLRDALVMILCGVTIGIGAAWMSSRFIATFLYGIDPRNLAAFIVGPIVLAAVSIAASFVPARRAAAVSASTALRYE